MSAANRGQVLCRPTGLDSSPGLTSCVMSCRLLDLSEPQALVCTVGYDVAPSLGAWEE